MTELVAVMGSIGQHMLGGFKSRQQRNGGFAISGVAGREQKTYRAALFVRRSVDFGRASAARATDGFAAAPFSPLAER